MPFLRLATASCVDLPFLNPKELGSELAFTAGSSAERYNACTALSLMVGIRKRLFSPFGLRINTLLNGEAFYSLVGGTGRGIGCI